MIQCSDNPKFVLSRHVNMLVNPAHQARFLNLFEIYEAQAYAGKLTLKNIHESRWLIKTCSMIDLNSKLEISIAGNMPTFSGETIKS